MWKASFAETSFVASWIMWCIIGDITAIRYFKSASDKGLNKRSGRIYSYPAGMLLTSTPEVTNADCPSGWVSIPLLKPLRAAPGQVYVVAIDKLDHYVKTADAFKKDVSRGGIIARQDGAFYGFESGKMPSARSNSTGTSNYYIDGKSLARTKHGQSKLLGQEMSVVP
jgi:hypothetical protein